VTPLLPWWLKRKDDAPNGPTSKEILEALNEMEGLDEDTKMDLFDILTTNTIKFERLPLPEERSTSTKIIF
jgi:hypothetical protein